MSIPNPQSGVPATSRRTIGRRLTTAVVGAGLVLTSMTVAAGSATATPSVATLSCVGLENELRALQAELASAPPGQKGYIISEIRDVERQLHQNHCPGW